MEKNFTEVTVDDRFYTLGEYKKLTDKQTQKLGVGSEITAIINPVPISKRWW